MSHHVQVFRGDLRDPNIVQRACRGAEVVFHLAARVGVGQSMYEIAGYTATNNMGTAVLLEELVQRPIERLIVASSMSIYGEGLYRRRDGSHHAVAPRSLEQLKSGQW